MSLAFHARRFDTREPVRVRIEAGKIVRVEPASLPAAQAAALPWVAPGFVDIQVNGWGGREFSDLDLTPEKVLAVTREHYAFGVTGYCPTLTTQSLDCLAHGVGTIHKACETMPEVARLVPGIHVEGPYFSTEDGPRGAHPKEHCRRPNWDEFRRLQDAANGRIKILTMSVEFDEAPDFVAQVSATGVVVSIGHTGANSEQIKAAVDAGARMSTHLGNGSHRMLRRHPNYIWDQLGEDRLTASLIVDGHHLPPEVVKSMVRAKTPERIVLVSDVSGLAGMPIGRYPMTSGVEVEILPSGKLVVAGQDQILAGASLPIGFAVANVMHFAGVDLPQAIAMASTRPAQIIGAPHGGLCPGDRADLVLFTLTGEPASLQVAATIAQGETIYGKMPAL